MKKREGDDEFHLLRQLVALISPLLSHASFPSYVVRLFTKRGFFFLHGKKKKTNKEKLWNKEGV